jgi:hypothetical protein
MVLLAATAPAAFVSDYNGAITNSGGGTTFAFAGKNGEDPLTPTYPFTLNLVNEGVGDDALAVINSFPSGTEYTYYGITIELTPEQVGTVDFEQYSQLSFKIKANTATAHNEFVVRVEDSDGGAEFNNTNYALPALTTDYQEFTIPLTTFQGGGQPANLAIAKNITFGAINIPGGGATIEVDFTVDDVVVDGPPLNPPPVGFVSDYNGTITNSGGGTTFAYAGAEYSDPLTPLYPFTLNLVNEDVGDDALQVLNSFPSGAVYTYYGITVELTPEQVGTLDLTQNSDLKFKIKRNTATAHNEFVVRVEDTDGGAEFNNTNYIIPPLTEDYQELTIPLTHFQGGGQPANLTIAKNITFGAINIPGGGATVEVDFTVDDVIVDGDPIEPPPPPDGFLADYNGTIINSGGGDTFGFAGAEYSDPLTPTFPFTLNLVNEGPDDDALQVLNSFPSGNAYTYYGITIELSPGQTSTIDFTQFSQLTFKIKANTPTAHNEFVVRVEDSDGGQEFNNTSYTLPALTTEYQNFNIPLTFFTGGGQPANLAIAKNITFGAINIPLGGSTVEVDFTIDDVAVSGDPVEPVPPLTNFFINFNNQQAVSPTGGTIGTDWGFGNPGFVGPLPTEFVELGPGNYAWDFSENLVNGGDAYSFVAFFARLDPDILVGRDVSTATHVKMDVRTVVDNNLDWRVRLEDSAGDPGLEYQNFNWVFDPPLTESFQTYTIPVEVFTTGAGSSGGGVAADLTKIRSITVFADAGSSSATPTMFARLTIDNMGFVFPTSGIRGDANNDGVINVADVTALYNFLAGNGSLAGDGDANNDSVVDEADGAALVDHIVNGTSLP